MMNLTCNINVRDPLTPDALKSLLEQGGGNVDAGRNARLIAFFADSPVEEIAAFLALHRIPLHRAAATYVKTARSLFPRQDLDELFLL